MKKSLQGTAAEHTKHQTALQNMHPFDGNLAVVNFTPCRLLTRCLGPHRLLPANLKHSGLQAERSMKELTKEVLDGMSTYIPLMEILQRLMQEIPKSLLISCRQDPVYSVGKYGEIKTLIFGILDAYIYEKCLELDASQIAASDCPRRVFKNSSQISILMDLSRQPSTSMDSSKLGTDIFGQAGILESADFKLNLAPTPLID